MEAGPTKVWEHKFLPDSPIVVTEKGELVQILHEFCHPTQISTTKCSSFLNVEIKDHSSPGGDQLHYQIAQGIHK
nr:hypothetical protein CFP56_65379 [Quercus suber]